MLHELWLSYMNFAWMLILVFTLILVMLTLIVSYHIAFGKGVLCIRIASFIILEMDMIEGEELKKLKALEKRQRDQKRQKRD